jgi:hypothetical protein
MQCRGVEKKKKKRKKEMELNWVEAAYSIDSSTACGT